MLQSSILLQKRISDKGLTYEQQPQEFKNDQNLRQQVPELPNFVRLVIYSYMDLREVLTKVRALNKKTKEALSVSEISRENKTFVWKGGLQHNCLLHDSRLSVEMQRYMPVLQLVSEVIFDLNAFGDDSRSCHKNYENVTELILSLPSSFDKRKVSLVHHTNLKSKHQAKFDWLRCSYILNERRPALMLRQLSLSNIANESQSFLDIFMRKCQKLKLQRCSFRPSLASHQSRPYELTDLELDQCEVDLTSVENSGSCLSKLKYLGVFSSEVTLPPSVRLENLTHLHLRGNESIKQVLSQIGSRLSGLDTLRLQFHKGNDLRFEDRYPLIGKHLPEGHTLKRLHIELINDEKNYILTAFLGEKLTLTSQYTEVTMSGLSIDAYVDGFEKFPKDRLESLVPYCKHWNDIKKHFVVTKQSVPLIKKLSLTEEKFSYSKQDPSENFEFIIKDVRAGSELRLRSQELFFTEGENQDDDVIFSQFIIQYFVKA